MQGAEERLGEQLSKLDVLTRAAGESIESRAAAAIETTSQEMMRRAEDAMSTWTEQLRIVQHAAGLEIEKFSAQLKSEARQPSERDYRDA